jgi:hypothetical protein
MESFDERLRAIEEKVTENNKMLHHLRNGQKNARFMKIVYFAIIVGMGYVSYTSIKPYLAQLQEVYGTVTDIKDKTSGLNLNSVTDLLKGIK